MNPPSPRQRIRRKKGGRASRVKRWAGILTVVVILFFILLNRHGILRLYRLRAEQDRLEQEIIVLQEQAVELRKEIASLENDLAYIERLAREKYRMVKRGEKVFRVVQPNRQSGQNDETDVQK